MLTEEEISMVLNTYMYMNYKEAEDGMTPVSYTHL